MAIDTQGLLDELVSHAQASGHFERVNQHEVTSAPGNGLTAAVWLDRAEPVPAASGLVSTSARLAFFLRIFQSTLSDPQDAIDPTVMAAVDDLMISYSGDFTLAGQVRDIDLLGEHGIPLSMQAGYVPMDDGKLYRVATITIPLILNDTWVQAP